MKKELGKNHVPGEARARQSSEKNIWDIPHFVVAGTLVVIFFWPAFYWAGKQLESGDEPWQLVFVPFLSLMVISQRLSEVRSDKVRGCARLGFPLMLGGALLNLFGIVLEHPMPSQVGMIAFLQGSVLYVWGKAVYRGLAFPLLYLFLAVPLPRTVLVAVTGSLKMVGAAVAARMLSWMGFAVVRDGAILKFPTFTLVVADECSGLQSLITLSVASLPVAYLMSGRLWRKALIVLASFPLALAANVVRLNVTAVLANKFGERVAVSWPHMLIGVVIVFLAFLALYGLSNAISSETEPAEADADGKTD